MRIISWNVNGIRAIAKKNFIEWFNNTDFDILCLQETKAAEGQVPRGLLEKTDYHTYFSWPDHKKGYSGVALFSKKEPLSVIKKIGSKACDGEGRIIFAEYKKFVLLNVYFPNGGASDERLRYKLDFYKVFLRYLNGLRRKKKKIVFCGDLNTAHKEIDLARPKENVNNSGFMPIEREWIDRFVQEGYIDTFRLFTHQGAHYTWWDYKTKARERNIGWRIDYFFVSDDLKKKVKRSFMMNDVFGSDHCPIVLDIDV